MTAAPSDSAFAFPQSVETWGGLTKREYYAARAPISLEDARQSMILSGQTSGTQAQLYRRLALIRFAYADAMIWAAEGDLTSIWESPKPMEPGDRIRVSAKPTSHIEHWAYRRIPPLRPLLRWLQDRREAMPAEFVVRTVATSNSRDGKDSA